jgi:hypothetical protein
MLAIAASCAGDREPAGAGSGNHGAAGAHAGGAGGGGGCTGDGDCAGDPGGSACDTASGRCVGCVPANDTCAPGERCDPSTLACAPGCKDDADCASDPAGSRCDPSSYVCVGCLGDGDCPVGQLCMASTRACVTGCSPTHACPTGLTCCGSTCHDLSTDPGHCGDCSKVCPKPANAIAECAAGMCAIGACHPAFLDCNGTLADGCEWNKFEDGDCACAPGATQTCYQGAPGTVGIGPCKAGTRTCDPSGTSWGPCVGQVMPIFEICNNNVDDDCDGIVDNVPDLDGDGWTACDGDCCDIPSVACGQSPAQVNPGAIEVVGDGIDNDCDPTTSDTTPPLTCSVATKLSGVTATDVAKAMDLCQFTTASPPPAQKKWGVISAQQLLADGSTPNAASLANIQGWQTAILANFGTGGVTPHKGATMAGISSGYMRDQNDPGYNTLTNQNNGQWLVTSPVQPPTAYTSQHGGGLAPGHCGAVQCPTGSGAYDSVNVRLTIRAPTNAQSFSYDFRFFSAEYQSYQCTPFNDYYLALLSSGAPGLPADHNISFDAVHNPVSVNNGFFQICGGNAKACGPCPNGIGALAGTGMQLVFAGDSGPTGGGTLWLTTDAPIVPGETLVLDLMIFDVSDGNLDSLVLLDNFRWNLAPATVSTHM